MFKIHGNFIMQMKAAVGCTVQLWCEIREVKNILINQSHILHFCTDKFLTMKSTPLNTPVLLGHTYSVPL
jgi:hypothetical protein